jgi:predicted nucleic acid-binding protein
VIAVDTSVVVAAFGKWNPDHELARRALEQRCSIPAHCGVEAFSVLTRLPDPFRAPPEIAAAYLRRRFGSRWLAPKVATVRALPARLARMGIGGGPTYDALVAATANDHGARLLTLDARAERTYRLMGAEYEVLV